jgi:GNAT superfamily N-acetyltransferase
MVPDLAIRRYRPADEDRVGDPPGAASPPAAAFVNPDGIEGGAITDPERHARESRTIAEEGVFLVGSIGPDAEGVTGGDGGEIGDAGDRETGAASWDGAGRIVAMGALDPSRPPDPAVAELVRMRVHPDHWRRGYGATVLAALEDHARDRGWTTLRLETLARQEGARALYEASGYEQVDRTVVDEFDVRRYRKHLDR